MARPLHIAKAFAPNLGGWLVLGTSFVRTTGSPAQRRTMHLLKFEMYRDVVDRISVESRESKL